MKKSIITSLTEEQFKEYIQNSDGYIDCMRKMGYNNPGKGSAFYTLKKYIQKYGCDISHFNSQTQKATEQRTIPLDEILVVNSTYTNSQCLKKRLVQEQKLEYKCSVCGNLGVWNDKTLVLQLEHINGIHNDNRIENLTFLCPNCHSQTPTFSRGGYGSYGPEVKTLRCGRREQQFKSV